MSDLLGQEWIVIGTMGAPYGIKGWNHVNSFTQPLDNILQYREWYVEQKGTWVAYSVMDGRLHGKGVVAQLKGIEDPETAAHLTQCKVAIKRSQLPELAPDEFYWSDLVGLTVQTKDGQVLGQIDYLYDNTGLDVMVVKAEGKELQIPFLMNDTVISVDLNTKIVVVDWEIPEQV